MVVTGLFDRMPITLRVVLARWFIYVLVTLPGLVSLQGHLNDAVGKRPWFHDVQMPLDFLNLKLVLAELGGGTTALMLGALLAVVLQLIWLAGAVRVLDPQADAESKKVFANGRPYLWRYLRIAFFALLLVIGVHLGVKAMFASLAARAELQSWPVEKSYFDLNLWRAGILFVLLTVVGVFVFWMRVITVVTDERKLRRLPRKVLTLYRGNPGSALLLQCAAVTLVLVLQATALFAWRQAGGGVAWFVAWLLLLLFAAWVWQWRVSSALRLVSVASPASTGNTK
jgi:hypothetical protein